MTISYGGDSCPDPGRNQAIAQICGSLTGAASYEANMWRDFDETNTGNVGNRCT